MPRALDLPDALSLARLPLAAVPWLAPGSIPLVLSAVVLAGVTDVLDGHLARRAGPARAARGAWLDPACDKVFVLSTLAAVATATGAPASTLALIALRELLLAPLHLALALARRRRPGRVFDFRAGRAGKATTGAQLAAVLALAAGRPEARALAVAAAALGALAAAVYARRGWRWLAAP
jgi:cardiolipin synthase